MLDQLNIETMLANRVALGPGLPSPRFLWVPFADALMYPLPTDSLIQNSDQKAFFALESQAARALLRRIGSRRKTRLARQYLQKVVTPTLQRHKQGGALAEKFEMAYLRSLAGGKSNKWPRRKRVRQAKVITARCKTTCSATSRRMRTFGHGRAPPHRRGRRRLFRRGGFESRAAGAALQRPGAAQNKLRDAARRLARTRGNTPLLTKPNAWVDFSFQGLVHSREVAATLRGWLEYVPEKVLFGTDAYPYSAEMGWQELR